jgi:hypothetical protein
MDIKTIFRIDMLTENSVSILKQNFIELDGQLQQVGENSRKAYVNTVDGRAELKSDVPDEQYNSVIAVWGDEPTVDVNSEIAEET